MFLWYLLFHKAESTWDRKDLGLSRTVWHYIIDKHLLPTNNKHIYVIFYTTDKYIPKSVHFHFWSFKKHKTKKKIDGTNLIITISPHVPPPHFSRKLTEKRKFFVGVKWEDLILIRFRLNKLSTIINTFIISIY